MQTEQLLNVELVTGWRLSRIHVVKSGHGRCLLSFRIMGMKFFFARDKRQHGKKLNTGQFLTEGVDG